MCESTAYSTDGSLIMEDVLLIKVDGNQIIMTDILNQKKEITGYITEINLDKHGIYIDIK
ncbi:MAG: hypothetical protein CVV28_12285 [Methanobacteriales archaeon HGW-Methanobacteriales-1]|jgi:hypothetical protein|nr:MAG: hypothetical protein CVV28_12285 [Methanobacteriales archaeon HGW-Methanobacteriales-1]